MEVPEEGVGEEELASWPVPENANCLLNLKKAVLFAHKGSAKGTNTL